ncbi:hypothetical protein [Sphingomonas sp.]|uniref:hypothetical protein n=1 Tax=Sphingomonas sp. TaxID=28214 RepID=UPI0035BC7403
MIGIDEPLRGARLQTRPKEVLTVEPFKDHSGQARVEPFAKDYLEMVRRIEGGLALDERFYRKRIEDTPDELLEKHGIKHFHLGGQSSDVLVFLAEYDDVVILLEINDHKHFETDPIGSLLISLHQRTMARTAEEAAGPAAERRAQEERAAARRRRLKDLKTPSRKKPE